MLILAGGVLILAGGVLILAGGVVTLASGVLILTGGVLILASGVLILAGGMLILAAYEIAEKMGVYHPFSHKSKIAGYDWLHGFLNATTISASVLQRAPILPEPWATGWSRTRLASNPVQ
ncbi:hypothetical protein LSAT2_026174, partial [Lamellibrachia satsuma]